MDEWRDQLEEFQNINDNTGENDMNFMSKFQLAKGYKTAAQALTLAFAMSASVVPSASAQEKITNEVVPNAELKYIPLNPARGDAAPQAGVLWGDIRKDVPSGVLLKFAPGFSSPPHIHNITYRAVVISGALYNGDENAEKMWMGPGSYWNQPAGEPHITAASKETGATAFLEILSGPYLVQPMLNAFDNGERPVNVDAGNVVWLDSSDVTWVDQSGSSDKANRVKMAFLWGEIQDGQDNGSFIKVPAGFSGQLQGNEAWLRAVVIKGNMDHRIPTESNVRNLGPGSYFGSQGGTSQQISCTSDVECLVYVRTMGRYKVNAN